MRTMPASIVLLALTFASAATAQDMVELREAEPIQVPGQRALGLLAPIKCGQDSSVFLQLVLDREDPRINPILGISPDGKQAVQFKAPETPGRKTWIVDFAPTADGGAGLLTRDQDGAYSIVKLDQEGRVLSSARLAGQVSPLQLALFPSGEALVSGWRNEQGSTGVPLAKGGTFTGIFDTNGRLEKEVRLPGDVGAPPLSDVTASKNYKRAVTLSTAGPTGDGNVFLARSYSGGPVYVISPGGEVVHSFQPAAPESMAAGGVQVEGNDAVTIFLTRKSEVSGEIGDILLYVWDITNGKKLATYHHASPRLGAALACYKSGVFTFLSMDPESGDLQLVHAANMRP
jgi:hypothetical protein